MVKPNGNGTPHPDKRMATPTRTANILAPPAILELTVSDARLETAPASWPTYGSAGYTFNSTRVQQSACRTI